MIAQDRKRDFTFLLLVDSSRDVPGRIDLLTINRCDNVAGFQSSFGRGTVFGDRRYQHAAIFRSKIVRQLFGQGLGANADAPVGAKREDIEISFVRLDLWPVFL